MVGVNIVECDYVILYGDGFTNVELAQIVGRAVRPCNKRKVTIISLKPTNEEGMKEVLAPFSIKLIYKPQQAVKKALIETQKQVLELFVEPFLNEKLLLTDYIVNENSCLRDFIKNRKKYNHCSEMILKSDDVDFLKNFKCINALQVSSSTELNETDENYISNNCEKHEYIINKCCVIDFKNNDFEYQFLNYSDLVVYKTLKKTIIVEKGFSELYGINCLASQEDVPFFVYAKYEHLFRLKNFKSKRFSDPKYKWKTIIIVSDNEEHDGLIRNEVWTTYAQYVFFTKRLEIP